MGSLHIIIEESKSMDYWKGMLDDLPEIFQSLGFETSLCSLKMIEGKIECFPPLPSDPPHIMLVSDCVSDVWGSSEMFAFLETWVKQSFVTIFQVFPSHMWNQTHLSNAFKVKVSTDRVVKMNTALKTSNTFLWAFEEEPVGIPVIRRETIEIWFDFISGKGNKEVVGYAFTNPESYQDLRSSHDSTDTTAEEKLNNFHCFASTEAWRLAVLLSAVPLTLPLARKIQESESVDYSALLEIFLSGLVERKGNEAFEFIQGVRELLGNRLPSDLAYETLNGACQFITSKEGNPVTLTRLVEEPEEYQEIFGAPYFTEFSERALKTLSRYGGNFARQAQVFNQSKIRGGDYNE